MIFLSVSFLALVVICVLLIGVTMGDLTNYVKSSIGRKQIIAITGLLLVGFLAAHLAGNLLIYLGPDAINAYAKKLHDLGLLLKVMEIGLCVIFLGHIALTIQLVIENKKSRKTPYKVTPSSKKRSFATKSMRVTGPILLLYLIVHLLDFTFVSPEKSLSSNINGQDMGLYGLIYNSFQVPWRTIFYVVAMCSLGLHLSHAIQSVFQTFGFNNTKYTPTIKRASLAIGVLTTIAYSSIPIYLLLTPPNIP